MNVGELKQCLAHMQDNLEVFCYDETLSFLYEIALIDNQENPDYLRICPIPQSKAKEASR